MQCETGLQAPFTLKASRSLDGILPCRRGSSTGSNPRSFPSYLGPSYAGSGFIQHNLNIVREVVMPPTHIRICKYLIIYLTNGITKQANARKSL